MELDVTGTMVRWLHILSAIALVGSVIFQRMVALPSLAAVADDETRAAVREGMRKRWAHLVGISTLLLLASGIVGIVLIVKQFPASSGKLPKFYHPVFGIKFLLAFGVFFLTSVLAGRSEKTRSFRDAAPKWLNVTLVLALAVVCLAGVLRATHMGPNLTM